MKSGRIVVDCVLAVRFERGSTCEQAAARGATDGTHARMHATEKLQYVTLRYPLLSHGTRRLRVEGDRCQEHLPTLRYIRIKYRVSGTVPPIIEHSTWNLLLRVSDFSVNVRFRGEVGQAEMWASYTGWGSGARGPPIVLDRPFRVASRHSSGSMVKIPVEG